jgi:HAD superfamily hydrolase (TIGR01509 family)
MSEKQIDALLFDFGNVLVKVDFSRVLAAWARAAGVPAARLAARFNVDDAYCAHERGTLDDAGYFAHLRQALAIPLSDEQFLSGWNEIFVEPVEEMEELLHSLSRAAPVYVFSNTNKAHSAHFIPRYESLLRCASAVICSCDIGCRKPEAQAFKEVARRLAVAQERIAFFDDLEENIAGAQAAGLRAFRVSSAAEIRAALPGLGIALNGNSGAPVPSRKAARRAEGTPAPWRARRDSRR